MEIFSQPHIHWVTGLSTHNQIFPLLSLLVTVMASNLVMEKVGVVLGPTNNNSIILKSSKWYISLLNIRKSEYTKESIDKNGKHIQMILTSILPKLSSQALLIIYSDHKARSLNSVFIITINTITLCVCVCVCVCIHAHMTATIHSNQEKRSFWSSLINSKILLCPSRILLIVFQFHPVDTSL